MKKYQIEYLRVAQKDLVEIFDYIRSDNPTAGANLLSKIDKAVSRLTFFPNIGIVPRQESLKEKGYRILIVESYLLFYLMEGTKIQVRRVIQGRRDYSFLL